MKIIGIDPGTLFTGYGVIKYENNKLFFLESGIIKTDSKLAIPIRLQNIFNEISRIMKIHRPDTFAIETAFAGKNIQSALKLGQARGVALLSATNLNIPVFEYSPREVKKAIVGKGNASKEQVKFMVATLLNLKKEIKKLDETDALSIAICHAFNLNSNSSNNSSWKNFIKNNPNKIIG